MKKLLIIPAILATVFSTSAAMEQADAIVKTTIESKSEVKSDDVFFVGQRKLKISDECGFKFSNIIGYKSISDAEQEKNGQVIGIRCNLVFSSVGYSWILDKEFVFYKEECTKENWIVSSKNTFSGGAIDDELVSMNAPKLPELKLLTPNDLQSCKTIESLESGHNGFDRNGWKGLLPDIDAQLQFILTAKHYYFFVSGYMIVYLSCVDAIKEWAKNLSGKDSYSNAEKVAIYIAVQTIVGAQSSTIYLNQLT